MSENLQRRPEVREKEPKTGRIACVHGYWLSEFDGKIGLSTRSFFAAEAARLMWENDSASNFIIPIGKIWGEGYSSLGEKIKDQITAGGVPEERVSVLNTAIDTKGEIKDFLGHSLRVGKTELVSLAFATHYLTIPYEYSRIAGIYRRVKPNQPFNIKFLTIEGIIEHFGEPELQKMLSEFKNSKYQIGHEFYEGIKRTAQLVHLSFLSSRSGGQRKGPIHPLERRFPMDNYRL